MTSFDFDFCFPRGSVAFPQSMLLCCFSFGTSNHKYFGASVLAYVVAENLILSLFPGFPC